MSNEPDISIDDWFLMDREKEPARRMTITEFLLARIAEDMEWWEARFPGDFRKLTPRDQRACERWLGECTAKRRIVNEARDYSPELEHGDNGEWAFKMALRALATVYADHPSFQPEWLIER